MIWIEWYANTTQAILNLLKDLMLFNRANCSDITYCSPNIFNKLQFA